MDWLCELSKRKGRGVSDKVFAEFENWAKAVGYKLPTVKFNWKPDGTATEYIYPETQIAMEGFIAGYAAGRKAEREAMQLKNWDGVRLGTTGNPEGER